MALFTPRGLKVRLAKPYAFALMARVFPKADAFRVLQLTEEVENLPALAGFVAGITSFSLHLSPIQIGIVVFATVFIFRLVHLFGFFVPPFTFLLPVSRIYSFVAGYGVLLVGLLIFGYFTTGWRGVLAFIIARISCSLVVLVTEVLSMRHVYRQVGFSVTASERSFFHAFRLLASRFGVSTDLQVSDGELAPSHWEHVFHDLAFKWPVVVGRFTDDTS
jgi:hypothetical protein